MGFNMNRECRDNIINDLGKLMKRVEYRLSVERLPLSEGYLKGGLKILADFNISCGGETHEYLAVFYRANVHGAYCEHMPFSVPHLKIFDADIINGRNKGFMFIGNIEVVNSPEKYIPSFVWLQRADYLDDIFSGSTYMSLFNHTLKSIPVVPKWEVDIFGVTTIQKDKINGEEIKSSAKIMDDIPNYCWEMAWNFLPNPECPELIRGVRVLLDNDTIRFAFDITSNVLIELTDVSRGPINF